MSNVLLVGAFGQGNPGDEALCAAFCATPRRPRRRRRQRRPAPTPRPATACRHPGRCASARARAAVAPTCVRVRRRQRVQVLHTSSAAGAPNALLRNAVALVAAAKTRGARVAMVGVGAGELRGRSARGVGPLARRGTSTCSSCATRSRLRCWPTPGRRPRSGSAPTVAWLLAGDVPTVAAVRYRHRRRSPSRSATSPATAVPRPACRRGPPDRWPRIRCTCSRGRSGRDGRDAELADDLRDLLGPDVKVLDAPDDLARGRGRVRRRRPRHRPAVPRARRRRRWPVPGSSPWPTSPSWPAWRGGLARSSVPAHATADVLRGRSTHALDHDPVSTRSARAQIVEAAPVARPDAARCSTTARSRTRTPSPGCRLSNGSGSW